MPHCYQTGYGHQDGGIHCRLLNAASSNISVVVMQTIPWFLHVNLHSLEIKDKTGRKIDMGKVISCKQLSFLQETPIPVKSCVSKFFLRYHGRDAHIIETIEIQAPYLTYDLHHVPQLSVSQEGIDLIQQAYIHTMTKNFSYFIGDNSYSILTLFSEMLTFEPARIRQSSHFLEFAITVPASSTAEIMIQFTKGFLTWTEHPPDAHHGFYVG